MTTIIPQPPAGISEQVKLALTEDLTCNLDSGDVTSQLISSNAGCKAVLLCREQAVLCGQPWVDETYRQLDPSVKVHWLVPEGCKIPANTECAKIIGRSSAILKGERTALNFLQLLSATATATNHYAQLIIHTKTRLLDSRKTVPGLRTAQKYAVTCGGGHNHRMGLFDAFLIKENHILAIGGIEKAILAARRQAPELTLEIEVESLDELQTALAAGPDIIMLDNFNLHDLKKAVELTEGKVKLEASGGITSDSLVATAETGVDYLSVGAITKDIKAIDFSLRVKEYQQ